MNAGPARIVRARVAESFTITCPSCAHEWQTLKPGRRARTCPKCGHVGARAAFAERTTIPAGPPAPSSREEDPAVGNKNGKPDDPPAKGEVHRPLAGAAKAAHDAKARGEPVKVGRPFGRGDRAPAAVRSNSSSSTKGVGVLDRIRRII